MAIQMNLPGFVENNDESSLASKIRLHFYWFSIYKNDLIELKMQLIHCLEELKIHKEELKNQKEELQRQNDLIDDIIVDRCNA